MPSSLLTSNQPQETGEAVNEAFPEKEIIRQAQEGDAGAFERIYRQYNRRVYAMCLRMTRNKSDAEDLTQEAFLQAFRKIHTFRGESAFYTWFHRLTVNVVLMSLRKRKHIEVSSQYQDDQDGESGTRVMEAGAVDPTLSGLFDRENLNRALSYLPAGYKRVLVLHDVFGYEHNEIAAASEFSVGNSKSQLHKARQRMRSLL